MFIDINKAKKIEERKRLEASNNKKYKALIVDDEPHNLHILSSLLSDKFEIITANDGEEAWQWLQTNPIDDLAAILTDQRMPNMSGMQLLEKSISICPDAIRIVLTGYTDIDSLMLGINSARIYQFIVKPYDKNQLTLIIDRALEAYERDKELFRRAMFDQLTKLPNRELFLDRVKNEIAHAKRDNSSVCIALFDIRRFRTVNDTLGHEAGDELILGIADRLKSVLRESDTISRITGALFAIALPDTKDVETLFQKILATVETQIELEKTPVDVSGSIGFSMYPENGDCANKLLQKAEIALNVGKDEAHPYKLYHQEIDKSDVLQLSLMGELRDAIRQDSLALHYQPKLNLKTDQPTHVEALIRWKHETRGPIFPDQFIPLAEQTGNIIHLTRWVIKTAVKQIRDWQLDSVDLIVSVNISTIDLNNKGISKYVADLLSEFNIPPEKLIFEVTESAIMTNVAHAIAELESLTKLGIEISIDDFGTGFSSMAQLKKMPVSEVKIDRSFVMDLGKSNDDRAIVSATIMMARELGLKVVAEGIEDEEVYSILKTMDCDMAQGYFMCKPIPANEIPGWIEKWAKKYSA